jgi:hypothetical protein
MSTYLGIAALVILFGMKGWHKLDRHGDETTRELETSSSENVDASTADELVDTKPVNI